MTRRARPFWWHFMLSWNSAHRGRFWKRRLAKAERAYARGRGSSAAIAGASVMRRGWPSAWYNVTLTGASGGRAFTSRRDDLAARCHLRYNARVVGAARAERSLDVADGRTVIDARKRSSPTPCETCTIGQTFRI